MTYKIQIDDIVRNATKEEAALIDAQRAETEAQAEAQARMQSAQGDVEIAYRKAQLDEYVAQQNLMIEQSKLQMKQRELELEMMRIQAEAAVKADSTEAKREADRIAQMIDLQRLELENIAVRMKESEKLLEERRLSQEQELEKLRMAMDARMQMLSPGEQKQQPIVINNVIPKASKRVGKISTDEQGNPSIEIDNVED